MGLSREDFEPRGFSGELNRQREKEKDILGLRPFKSPKKRDLKMEVRSYRHATGLPQLSDLLQSAERYFLEGKRDCDSLFAPRVFVSSPFQEWH